MIASPKSSGLPRSILFVCSQNAVRSPMAEALADYVGRRRIFVRSAGIRPASTTDGFSIAVMQEIGLDIAAHEPQAFDAEQAAQFQLLISLSPEAQHSAVEAAHFGDVEIEYWPTEDPTLCEGSRDEKLVAYRRVRDALEAKILERFSDAGPGHL